MANNPYVNKVVYGGQTLIDISDTTATADKILQGYTAYGADGQKLTGTASGGGSVTWETIYDGNVTIVTDSPNYAVINNWAPTHPIFADGQTWRVTWNGTEYVCPVKETEYQGAPFIYIGNAQQVGAQDQSNEPFFAYMRTSTQLAYITADPAGSITLKMELQHDTSATLITKSITVNGTYTASSDSADGYSSVTVNVPTDTPTIQSLTVNPSTTQQTFNASGVDGYKPVTVNAMPSGTAGTPTATKGTVSNHSVSVTPSVTNTTGYITGSTKTGTAVTVSASELVSGTLSLSDNGTADCTNYASVNVNIPFVTYYTGTSTPASSLGSDGDIYLKTV